MALNYVKGIISHMGEIESGTTQNGNSWSRQVIVLDIASFGNTYSKIALTVQNQRVNEMQEFAVGDRVEVGYAVTAREWNGKWFNNVDLINIKMLDESASAAPASAAPAPVAQPAPRKVARPANTTPLVRPGAIEPQIDDMPF